MDTATRVQILDVTDCISHSTNTLGKGMNPIILPIQLPHQFFFFHLFLYKTFRVRKFSTIFNSPITIISSLMVQGTELFTLEINYWIF